MGRHVVLSLFLIVSRWGAPDFGEPTRKAACSYDGMAVLCEMDEFALTQRIRQGDCNEWANFVRADGRVFHASQQGSARFL